MGPPLEGLDSALGAEREIARRDKEGDREAGEMIRNYEYKSMIDSPRSAEGIVYIIHSAREIVQLRTRLPAFLQLPPASDSKYDRRSTRSSQGSDAPAPHTHSTKTPRLHRRSPTRVIRALHEGEAGGAVRLRCAPAGGRGDGRRRGGLVRTGVLCVLLMVMLLELLLMLLGASGNVGVLIREDAYDAGGDFVVNDGLVIVAYDTDAGFLLGLIRTK